MKLGAQDFEKSRGSSKEEWITLKEAARISGYSADYIGELIRKGKIPGKQVVWNVAWMTTKEAILEYKERQKKKKKREEGKKEKFFEFFGNLKRRILVHFEVLKLIFSNFKEIFILSLVLILILLGTISYLIFSIQKKPISKEISQPKIENSTEYPSF